MENRNCKYSWCKKSHMGADHPSPQRGNYYFQTYPWETKEQAYRSLQRQARREAIRAYEIYLKVNKHRQK